MKDTDLAWCAGIIDGEGTITFKTNSHNTSIVPTITFTMTHEQTVRHFKSIVQVGTVTKQNFEQSPNHKDKFMWLCGSVINAILVAKLIEPYLITKKQQAKLVLEFASKCIVGKGKLISIEVQAFRSILLEEMKEINKKGPK